MNKFYMNGKLIHKVYDRNAKRCEVEKCGFKGYTGVYYQSGYQD